MKNKRMLMLSLFIAHYSIVNCSNSIKSTIKIKDDTFEFSEKNNKLVTIQYNNKYKIEYDKEEIITKQKQYEEFMQSKINKPQQKAKLYEEISNCTNLLFNTAVIGLTGSLTQKLLSREVNPFLTKGILGICTIIAASKINFKNHFNFMLSPSNNSTEPICKNAVEAYAIKHEKDENLSSFLNKFWEIDGEKKSFRSNATKESSIMHYKKNLPEYENLLEKIHFIESKTHHNNIKSKVNSVNYFNNKSKEDYDKISNNVIKIGKIGILYGITKIPFYKIPLPSLATITTGLKAITNGLGTIIFKQ